MEKTISLRFRYTEEEYIAAMRLYLMRSRDLIVPFVASFLYTLLCIFLFKWLDFGSELMPIFLIAAFLPFIIAFLLYFVVPRQRFRGDPKFADEYLLQFSEDGIHFKTAQIDSILQWSLYNKVLENERFYILVYGKNMISVIPRRAFASADQETAFAQMLRRNIPAYANARHLKEHSSAVLENSCEPPATPPDWR